MKVRIASSDPSRVRSLKEKYSLSLLAATILERRGVEAGEDVMYFLESDTVYLHSPFESDDIYRIVTLDDRCRKQQVGEGWFSKVSDVPEKAVTMLPKAIMGVRHIITACPHTVKAEAVIKAITTSVSPRIPSTILKTHPDWKLFLDRDSASLLLGM